jgi:chromosome segregation ATPase
MADLKGSFFGYSRASVRSVLAEREAMLDRASRVASAAEQRADRFSSELSQAQGACAELGEQLDAANLVRARLEEDLRIMTERAEQATTEAAESQQALRRALEGSAQDRASLEAHQQRLAELEGLLTEYREEIERRAARTIASVEPTRARAPEPEDGPATATELAAVIEVTEQAVLSIMESTKARADLELHAVDAERERIKRDVESMTAWRDRAAPVIDSLEATMSEVQRHVGEVGARVSDVLRPVTSAVTQLASDLASLDTLAEARTEAVAEATRTLDDTRVIELRDRDSENRDAYRDR